MRSAVGWVIGVACEVNQVRHILGDKQTDPDDHDHEGDSKANHKYWHHAPSFFLVRSPGKNKGPIPFSIEPLRRFRDGPQAKHVPRGQRELGRGSITVSLITLTYKPKWSESDTGTEVPMSVGAG